MSFLRSAQGIANYPVFYGVDLFIFTEGRKNISNTTDERFYQAILNSNMQNLTFQIKTIGNCNEAVDHFEIIKTNNLKNFLVFVDKDLHGVTKSSLIEDPQLIFTHGYSWESDFWSIRLVLETIQSLGNLKLENEDLLKINSCLKKAHLLSSLDVCAQIYGSKIIDKQSKTGGIDFGKSKTDLDIIHTEEKKRLIRAYNTLKKM